MSSLVFKLRSKAFRDGLVMSPMYSVTIRADSFSTGRASLPAISLTTLGSSEINVANGSVPRSVSCLISFCCSRVRLSSISLPLICMAVVFSLSVSDSNGNISSS